MNKELKINLAKRRKAEEDAVIKAAKLGANFDIDRKLARHLIDAYNEYCHSDKGQRDLWGNYTPQDQYFDELKKRRFTLSSRSRS